MKVGTAIIVAVAALETVLVMLWIGGFALGGDLGTPHQFWYLDLPVAFLVAPIGASIGAIFSQRVSPDLRTAALFLMFLLLGGNLIALFAYAAISGGGV